MGESKCGFGGRRKTSKIGPLKKGLLSSTGYSVKNSLRSRHRSLKKLLKKESPLKVFRQLNAVAVYDKNSAPTKSRTFKRDRNWIRKTFMRGGGIKEDALQLLKDKKLITGTSEDELDTFVFKSGKMQERVPFPLDGYTFYKRRRSESNRGEGWKLEVEKDGETVILQTFSE